MNREQAFQFIVNHRNLLEESKLTDLFREFNDITDNFYDTHYLTDILIGAGIDPLEYMSAVPVGYLYKTNLNIKEINVPDNIINIYMYAFTEANLEKVVLPKTIVQIGWNAFHNNPKLSKVYVRGTQDDVDKIKGSDSDVELVPMYD